MGLMSPAVSRLPWCLLLVTGAVVRAATSYVPSPTTPPQPQREFRAAWIGTVANITWPSTNALSTAQQKRELLALLNRAVELKLNAIILQVRPACDALYASELEPWSEYLTRRMGRPPKPFYDPLAFAVEEAHRRGLELHAWFNPYRARFRGAASPVAPTHISQTHPELVRSYGKYLWLDPGEKQVQDYSLRVIVDVVKRYDIDGVHLDDYFYPYAESNSLGKELEFPDEASWRRFGAETRLSREDWRRENVNRFIQRVYESIKAEKKWVKFGISPFGIWRPGCPPSIKGYDAYARLYADSRKWLANGWVDYLAPQLYWAIEPTDQSFPVLLKWWTGQNTKDRHVFAGLDTTKVGSKWPPAEILNQIRLTREQAGCLGHIHWNMGSLMRSNALTATLKKSVYAHAALVPASPWLGSDRPAKPMLQISTDAGRNIVRARWRANGSQTSWLWLIQTRSEGVWVTDVSPAATGSKTWSGRLPEVIAVSAVDRNGNTSLPTVMQNAKPRD